MVEGVGEGRRGGEQRKMYSSIKTKKKKFLTTTKNSCSGRVTFNPLP